LFSGLIHLCDFIISENQEAEHYTWTNTSTIERKFDWTYLAKMGPRQL